MHQDEHDHRHAAEGRSLLRALIIVIVVMVAEIVGGILSGSLALLADAGHMFVDALAMGLALTALAIARRPATLTKTFGFHRAEILAALANGTILVVVSIIIFYEAYQRFFDPPVVKTPLMLTVAVIGLFANLAGVLLLNKSAHNHLGVRAAFWHVIGDALSSVGVIIAGLIIMFTGYYLADPIVAVLMGVVILWGAVKIVTASVDILLEGVPSHIDADKVIEAIRGVPGVNEIHDIHIWTIASSVHALSAHLIISDQTVSQSEEIVSLVEKKLAEQFDITHTTLQLECSGCELGMVCQLSRPRHTHHDEEITNNQDTITKKIPNPKSQ